MDIDGRQNRLLEKLLPNVQQSITKIIQFSRTLPGFSELSCDDQVALIKGKIMQNKMQVLKIEKKIHFFFCLFDYSKSIFKKFLQCRLINVASSIAGSRSENWFIGEHKYYNTQEGLYTNSTRLETVDMNEMAKVTGNLEIVNLIFKIATRLQQCNLTDEEVSLYKAVAIMQRGKYCITL